MEGIYSGTQHIGEEGGLRKCKRSFRRIQEEDKYRGEEARKVRYGREKGLQERGVTREIYGENVI